MKILKNPGKRLIRDVTIGCLLLLQLAPMAFAREPLSAFEANYELFYGKTKAGNAKISLTQDGDNWHWLLQTKPTGLLSLLTNKEPYSETIFIKTDDGLKTQQITMSEGGKKDKLLESAKFDWNKQKVDMLRKDVSTSATLSTDVYDYLSVHLLSAKMQNENLQLASVEFYYKGGLIKLQLKQLENAKVTANGKDIDVVVFEQSMQESRTKSIYYYDPATPYIPLKIETTHPEKKTTTMVFVPPK
jgi:hypothetical protein